MPQQAKNPFAQGKVYGSSTNLHPAIANYDPYNIVSAAADSHGHSSKVRWNVGSAPKELIAEAQKIIDDPRSPYRGMAEYVRDAMFHRNFFWLKAMADPKHDWGMWGEFAERERLKTEAEYLEEEIDKYQADLVASARKGDTVWMQSILASGKRAVTGMREPYRTRLSILVKEYESRAGNTVPFKQD